MGRVDEAVIEYQQLRKSLWSPQEPSDAAFVAKVRDLLAEAHQGARELAIECGLTPIPMCQVPPRPRRVNTAKVPPVKTPVPAPHGVFRNPDWPIPDAMMSPSRRVFLEKARRRRAGQCVSCGTPLDDFMKGCENCYNRHYGRRKAGKSYLAQPNRVCLKNYMRTRKLLAGPNKGFHHLTVTQADIALMRYWELRFPLCAKCVTTQTCRGKRVCVQSRAFRIV